MSSKVKKEKAGFLGTIERVGNALPHPFVLFLLITGFFVILAAICDACNVEVLNGATGEMVAVKSILNKDGFNWLMTSMVGNFSSFAALGVVLAMQMAIGVAEGSGLLTTAMRRAILNVPTWLLTAAVVFLGINGSIASEAAIIFVPPLAATAFLAAGKHPVAGLIAGYAAVNAGFTANLMITATDALLYPVTLEVAQGVDPSYTTTVANNWYFMIVSCLLLTVVGVFVNNKFIAPRLGTYTGGDVEMERDATDIEKKGLRNAGIFSILYIALILIGTIPSNGFLRGEDGTVLNGPFITGLVGFLIVYFILVGYIYGKTVGVFKKSGDMPKVMADSLNSLTGYVVLVFVIAQFIQIFNYTNIGTVIAVGGADILKKAGLTGIPMVLGIIIITTFVNFFMTSGTAKWYIFAPIFVPMFMMLGYTPEFAQVVYRIGDSCTNPITPIYPYLPMIIGMASKYDKKAGVGTIISMTLPYSIAFLISWTIMLILWMVFKLPLGPGAAVFM